MAIRRNKPKREKKVLNSADTPSASDLFVQPPADTELCDEPASANQANTPMQSSPQTEHASSPVSGNRPASIRKSKFAVTQKILIAGVVISTALLTYSLVFSPPPLPPGHTFPSPQDASRRHGAMLQPASETTRSRHGRSDEPASASNAPQAQIAQVGITQPQVEQKESNKPSNSSSRNTRLGPFRATRIPKLQRNNWCQTETREATNPGILTKNGAIVSSSRR